MEQWHRREGRVSRLRGKTSEEEELPQREGGWLLGPSEKKAGESSTKDTNRRNYLEEEVPLSHEAWETGWQKP